MKISFNATNYATSFKGINEAVNRIRSQIQTGGFVPGDTFTKAQDNGTVIIENYYEKGQSTDIQPQNPKGNAAVEGAVSGTTTGSAIEGTKSVAEKIKEKGDEKGEKTLDATDTDDSSAVDLLGENDSEHSVPDSELDSNFDVASDIDIDADTEIDTDLDLNPEVDVEPEIDIDPEVDLDPDFDLDFDITDIL